MAQRRMFTKTITSSARFIKMPVSARELYFQLCMYADDDGIVEAFTVMRLVGASEDDIKVLAAKTFITVLNEDLVTYINDWLEHNLIRSDRKVDSKYKNLLVQVIPDIDFTEKKPRIDTVRGQKEILSNKKDYDPSVMTQSQIRESTHYLPSYFRARVIPHFVGKPCPICNREMTFEGKTMASIQHNRPIALGGEHRIENISVICFECNMKLKNIITESLNNQEVREKWEIVGPSNVSPTSAQVRIGQGRLGKENHTMSSSQEANIDGAPVFKKLERGTPEYVEFCAKPIDPTNTRAIDWGSREILDFLNNNCGRQYRPNEVNLGFIQQRLKSGVSITTCRSIIEAKRKEWQSRPDMEKYLRPATLFNKTKFEQYLGELHA